MFLLCSIFVLWRCDVGICVVGSLGMVCVWVVCILLDMLDMCVVLMGEVCGLPVCCLFSGGCHSGGSRRG